VPLNLLSKNTKVRSRFGRNTGGKFAQLEAEVLALKLIHIAKRRADGLIDENWIAGFEAYKSNNDRCPHVAGTAKFDSWVEGWTEAGVLDGRVQHLPTSREILPHSSI